MSEIKLDIALVGKFTNEMLSSVMNKYVDENGVVNYEGKGDLNIDACFLAAMVVGLPSALQAVFTGKDFNIPDTLKLFIQIASDLATSATDDSDDENKQDE